MTQEEVLKGFTDALGSESHPFHLDGSEVHVLHSPDEYYRELRTQIQGAKRHVALSALYLGTGEMESTLIDDLGELLEREPKSKVTFIFDFNRAHRLWQLGDNNKQEVPQYHTLLPLLRKYGEKRVSLKLYEMPPTSALKQRMSQQAKEILGVYHVKFSMVDDNVIVTGANLSEEYFDNRQDRYLVVPGGAMAPFFESFIGALSKLCFHVNSDGSMKSPELSHESSKSLLMGVLTSTHSAAAKRDGGGGDTDTVVVPFMQHAPVGIEQESQRVPRLLQYLTDITATSFLRCASLVVSSPYPSFRQDLTDGVTDAALAISNAHPSGIPKSATAVISAETSAHGFGGERGLGVKALIPKLHDHILASSLGASLDRIKAAKDVNWAASKAEPVTTMRYRREGWSFHSKGIWAEVVNRGSDGGRGAAASITFVGSSNMGERSLGRDMELGFMMVTKNKALQEALAQEVARTLKYCQQVPLKQLYAPSAPPSFASSSSSMGSLLHSRSSIAFLSKLLRRVL